MGYFWGLLKFHFFIGGGGVLEIPDFFGANGRWLTRAYVRRKNESTPPPLNTPMIDWCNAQLQFHKRDILLSLEQKRDIHNKNSTCNVS